MLNIAICESNVISIKKIEESILITLFDECEFNIDLFTDSLSLIQSFQNGSEYDLVFIDTELKDTNGIKTAAQIRNTDIHVEIVFLAGDDSFVFDGYRFRAFDYMIKPVSMSRLAELFRRYFFYHSNAEDYFLYKVGNKVERIKTNSILYFYSTGRIVSVVTTAEKIEFYAKLDAIEESLSEKDFVRIHQSYLVNKNYVKRIEHTEILLDNKYSLPISRNRQKYVKEKFLV